MRIRSSRFILPVLLGVCLAAVASGSESITLTFEPPVITDSADGSRFTVPGAPEALRRDNRPEIPCRTIVRDYPFGTRVRSVTARCSAAQTVRLDRLPALNNSLYYLADPARRVAFPAFDPALDHPAHPLQWEVYGGRDPGTLQFTTRLVARVFPARIAGGDRLLFTPEITLTIETDPPASPHRAETAMREADGTYVIVAPDAFVPVLADYVTHRTATGLEPELVTIESILQSAPGVDEAEKLRHYVRSRVEMDGTAFVMLAGDADRIPVRRTVLMGDPTLNVPMEQYFGDLFDAAGETITWDADGDNLFGEYPDDLPAMDMLPDVFVARIPASTETELAIALANVIAYETSTAESDAWFNRVQFNAVDIFTYRDHGDISGIPEGERFAEMLASGPFAAMSKVRVYETDLYPHDAEAQPENIVSLASQGCGFMAFHCHGAPNCFWLIDDCFDNSHADQLTNGAMLPVTFGFACSTAAFDNELSDWPYSSGGESMPERFLLNANGGAIAFVGATRGAVAGLTQSQHLKGSGAVEYPYSKAFSESPKTPALMMAFARKYYLEHTGIQDAWDFLTLMEYNQFGDPTVSVGGVPPQPRVTAIRQEWQESDGDGDGCFEPGETVTLDVTLMNAGSPAAQVTATLESLDPEVQVVSGSAGYGDMNRFRPAGPAAPFLVRPDPAIAGNRLAGLRLSIFVQGVLHCQVPVDLFVGSGPELRFDGWDVYYDSFGNCNPDPGETIYPAVLLRNIGCQDVTALKCSVTTGSPFVTSCWSLGNGIDIPAGRGGLSEWAACVFTVSESCPDGTPLEFQSVWTGDASGPWQYDFTVTVQDRRGPRLWEISAEPRAGSPGEPVRLLARALDVSGVESVRAFISTPVAPGIPGPPDTSPVELLDDGAHGDGDAGDGLYGGTFSPPAEAADFVVLLAARDGLGNTLEVPEACMFTTVAFEPADVLVVDSSGDLAAGPAIADALEALGIGHAVWSEPIRGPIGAAELALFQAGSVVWTFGVGNYPGEGLRETIAHHLDAGGGMLISGWDLARNVRRDSGAEWLADYFGAASTGNNADGYGVLGVAGDPATEGLDFRLKKTDADGPLTPDRIVTAGEGIECLRFITVPDVSAGTRRDEVSWKSMLLPYSVEGIRYPDQVQAVLGQVLPWLADRHSALVLELALSQSHFTAGDPFRLELAAENPFGDTRPVQAYVVLAVADEYWFWPSWTATPGVDFKELDLGPVPYEETILDFTWPEVDAGMEGILFYGALIDPATMTLASNLETETFGFE